MALSLQFAYGADGSGAVAENRDGTGAGHEAGAVCRWLGCGKEFGDGMQVYAHIMDKHVAGSDKDTDFVCYWEGCARALKAFTTRAPITSHMRTHFPTVKFETRRDAVQVPPGAGMGNGRETPVVRDMDDEAEQGDDTPLSIDQAIHTSIANCGSDELKKRMYNTILLTGGGHLVRGFVPALEFRYGASRALLGTPDWVLTGTWMCLQPVGDNAFICCGDGSSDAGPHQY